MEQQPGQEKNQLKLMCSQVIGLVDDKTLNYYGASVNMKHMAQRLLLLQN